jgi:hypothetical protein
MSLDIARQAAELHLNKIAEHFKPGAQLTLIVRTPTNNEADFVLSSEHDLNEAVAALNRRIDAH